MSIIEKAELITQNNPGLFYENLGKQLSAQKMLITVAQIKNEIPDKKQAMAFEAKETVKDRTRSVEIRERTRAGEYRVLQSKTIIQVGYENDRLKLLDGKQGMIK